MHFLALLSDAELDAGHLTRAGRLALRALYREADLNAALQAIPSVPLPPGGENAPAESRFRTCVSVPKWLCIVSIITGECIGSAMCPGLLRCSAKCVAVVLPPL